MSPPNTPLDILIREQKRVHAGNLRLAIVSAVGVAVASTALLARAGTCLLYTSRSRP